MTKAAGWAAKIGPETLSQVLRHIPKATDPKLLVGLDTSDDAAVYQICADSAVIQTVDFFPPMVDDPYMFGQIAAANALSDVYAMGGKPVLALNIVCFPNCLPVGVLEDILRGGADKVTEAGAIIAGGHSVEDNEPKYGLAVTGVVHPQRILTNAGAKVGDMLILTKPLGTGIINTAIKGGLVGEAEQRVAAQCMAMLNAGAAKIMSNYNVSACTDITGFGLLGHATEMAQASNVTLEIFASDCPLLPGVVEFAKMGMIPGGAYNNRQHVGDSVTFAANVPRELQDILFDPQTSGGLLISVAESDAEQMLKQLNENEITSRIIGRVQWPAECAIKVI